MRAVLNAHPAQLKLAKLFSSVILLGPELDEKVVRLIMHLFTPEEAELAQHLPFYYPRSLEKIARKAGLSKEQIEPLLKEMSAKRTILETSKGYSLLPLIPGMFERILMSGSDSPWHQEYARLLVDLYGTGFVRRYTRQKLPAVRNIPLQKAVESKSQVVDEDLISELIEYHQEMGIINVCQCRQSMHFIGKECKRASPEDGCLVFGSFARSLAKDGNGRIVSKEEMREVVRERWEKKLVFLTGNVSVESPNAICTCCDCCCHFLEAVNHYGGKSLLADAHFLVELDAEACDNCGKCVKVCNTYAHQLENKKHTYYPERCIGCGACLLVCKSQALKMVENPAYQSPTKDFKSLGLKLLPGAIFSGIKARFSK